MNLTTRIDKAEAEAARLGHDDRFSVYAQDREAWEHVSAEERESLTSEFGRHFPDGQRRRNTLPIIVCRDDAGAWRVATFNTPLGRLCYIAQRCIEESPRGDIWARWIAANATPAEVAAVARWLAGYWSPSELQPGDVGILETVITRMPLRLDVAPDVCLPPDLAACFTAASE